MNGECVSWKSAVDSARIGAYTFTAITGALTLYHQGEQMDHCLPAYWRLCQDGYSRIPRRAPRRRTRRLRGVRLASTPLEERPVPGPAERPAAPFPGTGRRTAGLALPTQARGSPRLVTPLHCSTNGSAPQWPLRPASAQSPPAVPRFLRNLPPRTPSGRPNAGHSPTPSSGALRATKRQSLANSILWCPPGDQTPVTRQLHPLVPSGRPNAGHSPSSPRTPSWRHNGSHSPTSSSSSNTIRATKRRSLANSPLWCPPGDQTAVPRQLPLERPLGDKTPVTRQLPRRMPPWRQNGVHSPTPSPSALLATKR